MTERGERGMKARKPVTRRKKAERPPTTAKCMRCEEKFPLHDLTFVWMESKTWNIEIEVLVCGECLQRLPSAAGPDAEGVSDPVTGESLTDVTAGDTEVSPAA